MSKKVNWAQTYKDPVKLATAATGQSSKELLSKAFEEAKRLEEVANKTKDLMPLMSKLFEIRATNGTPLKIMRPIQYQACEMVKSEKSEGFVEAWKTIHRGDELLLKSLDPNLQVFIFTNKKGEELEIAYTDQIQLLTNSDIFEVCESIYKK